MRKKIVAGNWKMNLTANEAIKLVEELRDLSSNQNFDGVKLLLIPTYVFLQKTSELISNSLIELGAQDVSSRENGAYTGEVSSEMLKSIGVDYCLLGHSERRQYHKEDNDLLSNKLIRLLESNISPIFCVGETLEQREGGTLYEVIDSQLRPILNLPKEQFKKVIVAYEPVWAIGTGLTATSDQAQEMHAYIRSQIAKKFGAGVSEEVTILYGGSCKASNAKELFSSKDVDGGLIGGASLQAEEFIAIAKSF